jgi:putative ABC transport system permease protein
MEKLKNICYTIIEKISPEIAENVKGDLEETYNHTLKKHGKQKASLQFIIEFITCLKLAINMNIFRDWHLHFIASWRYLLKNKSYFTINVFGLSVSLGCGLLIFFFILNETSYDRFHANGSSLYRITNVYTSGSTTHYANTSPGMIDGIRETFPEIRMATRMRYALRVLLEHGEKSFYEDKVFYADSMALQVLSYDLLEGDYLTALDHPNNIVITEEMAMKYFGVPRPMGEFLTLNGGRTLQITGILAPIPKNSHLQFDCLISFSSYDLPEGYVPLTSWTWAGFLTYIVVEPNVDVNNLKIKLDKLVAEHVSQITSALTIETFIQPVKDIYLGSSGIVDDLDSNIQAGNPFTIYSLGVVAILILLIGGFNFMNLTAATFMNRGKEIGVRKVMGANKKSLMVRLLSDTTLICIIAIVLAFLWAYLIYYFLRGYLGWDFATDFNDILFFLPFIFVITIVLGIISGLYPSLQLAKFNMVQSLKGQLVRGRGMASGIRASMVVAQFCISVALIVATVVIHTQINFMREKALGFDKENIVTMKLSIEDMASYYNNFKETLLQSPHVQQVSQSERLIGEPWPYNGFHIQERDQMEIMPGNMIGYDFMETFGLKLKEGRMFSRDFPRDSAHSLILNERAVEQLGIQDPIGKTARFRGREDRTIIGIVEDFNFSSLHDEITPLGLIMPNVDIEHVYVRVTPGNMIKKLEAIQDAWDEVSVGTPLNQHFMDDHLNSLYENEDRLSSLISGFSVTAVVLACLGIFGLISYSVSRRLKEIGIRKTLGASVWSILFLLSRQYMILIGIASVIAYPLVDKVLDRWLENFAYQIKMNPVFFISASLILLVISLITISGKTIKAAMANPVKVLRTE